MPIKVTQIVKKEVTEMRSEKILYLSTAHLSTKSRDMRTEDLPESLQEYVSITPTDFGSDISIGTTDLKGFVYKLKDTKGVPLDMRNILTLAADIGYSLIRLDSDEEPLPWLTRYEDDFTAEMTIYMAYNVLHKDGKVTEGHTSRFNFQFSIWPDMSVLTSYENLIADYAFQGLDAKAILHLRTVTKEEYETLNAKQYNQSTTAFHYDMDGDKPVWKVEHTPSPKS